MYKHNIWTILFIIIIYCSTFNALKSSDIIILIISQENEYNSRISENLEQNIVDQSKSLNNTPPIICLSHRDFSNEGHWTILPILPKIVEIHKWLLICNENTRINLKNLLETLSNYDSNQEIWLGYALFDQDITIIHHFAFPEDPTKFLYPNIASGFALSTLLVKKISAKFLTESYKQSNNNDLEFSIDASHELSLYIWDQNKGVSLLQDPNFCIKNYTHCATYVQPFQPCGHPVDNDSIYFAVKTCEKYHLNRLKTVKNTWAKYIKNIRYFSDIEDSSIPTVFLNIPNTEYGHCEKTFNIIKYAYNEFRYNRNIKWLIIVDDDTILSPFRICTMLSCYKNIEFLAIGERYGYRVRNLNQKGYNYLTGGAGTILSRNLVEKIVHNPEKCFCSKIDNPDDMILGICLARLGIKVVHSQNFHQARPSDYPPAYLSRKDAISFHKHWMIDPEKLYKDWFELDDKKLSKNYKTEL